MCEMFQCADRDGDGMISYAEFQDMINPPRPPPEHQSHQAASGRRVTINTTAMVDSTDTIESHIDDKDEEEEALIISIDKL